MMAFFLVMWLINAANEKTKAQVASYFNPVKLTDASTSKKGLNEPTKVTSDRRKDREDPSQESKATSRARLRRKKNRPGPIHGRGDIQESLWNSGPAGRPGLPTERRPGHSTKGLAIVEIADPGHKGGEAFRDPFDPFAWKSVTEPEKKAAARGSRGRQKLRQRNVTKETARSPETLPKQTVAKVSCRQQPVKSPEPK